MFVFGEVLTSARIEELIGEEGRLSRPRMVFLQHPVAPFYPDTCPHSPGFVKPVLGFLFCGGCDSYLPDVKGRKLLTRAERTG